MKLSEKFSERQEAARIFVNERLAGCGGAFFLQEIISAALKLSEKFSERQEAARIFVSERLAGCGGAFFLQEIISAALRLSEKFSERQEAARIFVNERLAGCGGAFFAGNYFRRVETVRNIFRKAGNAVTTDKPLTIDELLEEYRAENTSEREKGDKFERLMKNFLLTYPPYLGRIAEVMLWKNFSDERDLGIDLVAKTFDGEFWAVQCKFYAESASVDKGGVDSFISNSGRTFDGRKFSARIFIATTNNFSDNANKMFQNQTPPISKITLETLRQARVDWDKLRDGTFGETAVKKNSPRDYQREAIDAAHEHFKENSRGKLIMACGTGKTFTSLKIAEDLTDQRGLILFLVPSLSLLGQTLDAWTADAQNPLNYICVCSDETVTKNLDDVILEVDLPVAVTNSPAEISARVELFRRQNPNRMTVVFSTYQSLDKVSAADLDFDLAICDEAHRTAGNSKTNDEARRFSIIHDNASVRAKRRLYMTATPKMFNETSKKAASDKNLMLWSMDDEEIFGREFYRVSFKYAIEKKLLSDYQLLIFSVSEGEVQQQMRDDIAEEVEAFIEELNRDRKSRKEIKFSFSVDDMAKLVGCLNALSKTVTADSEYLLEGDLAPMHKAVAFLPKIVDSEVTAHILNHFEKLYKKHVDSVDKNSLVTIEAAHVDGSMNAAERKAALDKIRDTPTDGKLCRIITNVRCLSEGVDVPSLDAVIFLSPKKSKVDIVQAVGRALRKFAGKKFGYIIVPIIASARDNPNTRDYYAANNEKYRTINEVVQALKAHDDAMNADVERLSIGAPTKKLKIVCSKEYHKYSAEIPFEIFRTELIAKVVDTNGNRNYWWHWAGKVSVIVDNHTQAISKLVASDGAAQTAFQNFLADLHKNINPTVTREAAIDMLAQHLVSRPVFEAIFDNYSFADQNPVSKSMSEIISALDKGGLERDRAELKEFYDSVREQCRDMGSAANRQKIIVSLYDNFFKQALPLTVQQLGIVYTPPEVVDFILNSVSDALQKHFHRDISDKNIHVLEPFAGTGTFLARLIQSGLIRPKDLLRKYQDELHANEIVLLAYYIAAVNIENAFHDASRRQDYLPFNGICLTDTFQTYENTEAKKAQEKSRQGTLSKDYEAPLKENFGRIRQQENTKIEIIIGNPPYSVGQKSANDNAQNIHYDKLEKLIADTYAAQTNAGVKMALYDSYIKAFRWASERISGGGIVGFVTNAGWLDGAAMDGLRACFEQDFSHIYIFNLRGNQRTQGETSRREGGKIFGSGSRAPIAITILVKVPDSAAPAEIHYCDIGDYLSRDDKLARILDFKSALSDNFRANEIIIRPNNKHDWINQRNSNFGDFIILGDKKDKANRQTFFCDFYSSGLKTSRDVWAYNFSCAKLAENMAATIDFYNSHSPEDNDPTKIVWIFDTAQDKIRGIVYKFSAAKIVEAMYRPFCKQNVYYDEHLNQRRYQMPKLFPTGAEENLLICVPGIGDSKEFSVIIVDKIPDLGIEGASQCFPLYWYEPSKEIDLFGESYERRDGVTDWILERARWRYFLTPVTKEDIFYYVYGFLHLPAYREKYAAELKKSLPRIILAERAEDFWRLSEAGRALAALHLNYETQEAPAGVEVLGAREDLRVTKMKLVAEENGTLTLIYNAGLKIVGIPARAKEYVVNGRSPLEWLVERYQIKTDKASGITNDPNDWCAERGEPEYILRLAQSLITVSLRTLEIVEKLPAIKFE